MGLPGRGERAAHARLNPESGATALPVGGGYAVYMGAGSPLSQVQGVGLYGPVGDAELERMETFYRERAAPIQLELASLADATLLPLLSRRGYQAVEQTHVLVRPIGGAEPAAMEGSPRDKLAEAGAAEVEVVPIRRDEVATWAESVLRCFFEDPAELPGPLLEGAIAMASIPMVSCWLARVGGRIAGGGAMVMHNRLALICGDGTLPEFRSRGVQTALLRARLEPRPPRRLRPGRHLHPAGQQLAAQRRTPGVSGRLCTDAHGPRVTDHDPTIRARGRKLGPSQRDRRLQRRGPHAGDGSGIGALPAMPGARGPHRGARGRGRHAPRRGRRRDVRPSACSSVIAGLAAHGLQGAAAASLWLGRGMGPAPVAFAAGLDGLSSTCLQLPPAGDRQSVGLADPLPD